MVRHTARIKPLSPVSLLRSLSLLLLLALPLLCTAQKYEILCESNLTGTLTLKVYDGDSTFHTFTAASSGGGFYFQGKVERPVLASLSHAAMRNPLFFYLENSVVYITLNASRPEASTIKGSRSNSEYRSLLTAMQNDEPAVYLRRYVMGHPETIYAPYLLYQQTASIDEAVTRMLFDQLKGDALHTYHYTLLARWLRTHAQETDGTLLPDFEYCDSKKATHRFSATRSTEGYTLIFVGASWCDICKPQLAEARKAMADEPNKMIVINLDEHPAGWDAPYVKTLGIDHLPYLILVDAEGKIVGKNLSSWEVEEFL